jgi:GT2 family glycosyltransferase
MTRVDLVLLSDESAAVEWPLGEVYTVPAAPAPLKMIESRLVEREADAILFWNRALGTPNPGTIQRCLTRPGHVWHAGLSLGMGGQPGLIDFAAPTWMLNRDPDPAVEASSWRLSLDACLILTQVLRQLGGVNVHFRSLRGAALEMGHRYISSGVFVRHIPWLVAGSARPAAVRLPLDDEFLFVRTRFKPWQFLWTTVRALLSGYAPPWRLAASAGRALSVQPEPERVFEATPASVPATFARVTVLIPTVDRYPYLRTVLAQLREQQTPPAEIIVVDQTPLPGRDMRIAAEFADLPLKLIYLDQAGQCTSRNAGLQASSGDFILLIDDDDEIEADLIQRHLAVISRFESGVSSGVADEIGAGPLPRNFRFRRTSDVFPANNSLVKREVFQRSGLFDLAYDQQARADGDLGMRVYLSGELMVLEPSISVLHHHAPRGGLRQHKARVITYASSRGNLSHRHLPSVSEIYLAKRYFTARQVRESLWLRAFGTFAGRGGSARKLLKALLALVMLPDTCWRIQQRSRKADRFFERYPQIPPLEPQPRPPVPSVVER